MPDPSPNVLEFTLQGFTANQIAIKVKNISGALLEKPLTIEVRPPAYMLDHRIIVAAEAAADQEKPPGVSTLDGIVTGATDLSVWAKRDQTDSIVIIMFVNTVDKNGDPIEPAKVAAGAEFTIHIPLNPNVERASVDLPYSYQHGGSAGTRVDGKLELKVDPGDWTPDVTLMSDQPNPTMIVPKTAVKIFWHIRDGVSATLRGPLPGGNAELTLSDSTTSNYKMSDGSFELRAVGPVTYLLHAQVKRPDGKPNVHVVKMLSLDVHTRDKYAYVNARPNRVLPSGLVEIDWAAWGVDEVFLEAGGAARKIPLTELTLSGDHQGMGVMRITAGQPRLDQPVLETTVNLNIELEDKPRTEATTKFSVIPWRKMQKSTFTGNPAGLAVAGPLMALLTTDGLWMASVGPDDFNPINYDRVEQVSFTLTTADKPKAWLALAALEKKFVVLRQTNQDDLQVALYNSEGKPDGLPIDLSSDLRPMLKRAGTVFDFAVYGGRVYVGVEAPLPGGIVRRVFSVRFGSPPSVESGPLLESLVGYRLLTFDDTLYALNRESGRVFRLTVNTAGKLEAYEAAPAVSQSSGQPSSMIKQGLFVPVGRVLAVLNPSSLPSLASLAVFGLKNVLRYERLGPPRDPNTIPQDLVYNPQHDRWERCGRGMETKPGMVCALRGGDSPRLWTIEPNGDTYTLTVGSEHLFSHDFVTKLHAKPLAPFLTKKREFRFINNIGMQFVPMNETCLKAGLRPFSATGLVELTLAPPPNPRPVIAEKLELRYNQADPPPTTLRFLVEKAPGVKHDYVLDATLSGPDFSFGTTSFKRIAVNAQGEVSVANVPGEREFPLTSGLIEVFPKQLINGIRLRIRNATPYKLYLRSPAAPDPRDREKDYDEEGIKVRYNTLPFSIYAHGAGELHFDVDFALPHGIEMTAGSESQTKRIRINRDPSVGLSIESTSVNETDEYDAYEFTLRYKLEKSLGGVYIGDGVPSKDGASFYLPLASSAVRSEVVKIDANNLLITESASVDGNGIFSAPNSVAVLADKVIAILKNNIVSIFDFPLKFSRGMPLAGHEVVTNLKGSPNDTKFFTLGMKQEARGPIKYSFSYANRSLAAPLDDDRDVVLLDAQQGFRPARVSGAPAWVSPSTISPMDVSMGLSVAICVEGGLILVDVRRKTIMEVGLEGTGREEAVLFDPNPREPFIFCAHARPDTQALMISRINPGNPKDKLTITLPSPVTHMVTDKGTSVGPNLKYNRTRAVSLVATSDALFVSHATKIYVLDKTRLTQRQQVTVDLPCRLIQVRRGKPPGENNPPYAAPRDCYLIWAIGSIYIGDGQNLERARTKLYKIGIMQ